MAQQSSRVTVAINGDQIRSKAGSSSMTLGGATVEDGDVTATDQGLVIWKEKHQPGKITTTLVHLADTVLDKILKTREATITYTTDTGVVYTMASSVALQLGELKDGECDVQFKGNPVAEKGK